MPEGVGLAEADGDGVDSGEALADGEALRLGLGVALAPAAAAQPPSTTAAALAAPSRANRPDRVPPDMHVGRVRRSGHARGQHEGEAATICAKQMPYAHSEDSNSVRAALGQLLRRRREEAEHSLTELAGAADLSPAYLSEVERGLKDISTDRLVEIARALQVSVADLYLDLARSLGSRDAIEQRRSWPDDPRIQLRIATANLRPQALRSVAHFSLYLAATQATPPKRRIGFTLDR